MEQQLSDFAIENGVLERYRGYDSDVIIPYDVTSIADNAFFWCESVESVTIPESVNSIGKNVFSGCRNLKTIYFEAEENICDLCDDWLGGCPAEVIWDCNGKAEEKQIAEEGEMEILGRKTKKSEQERADIIAERQETLLKAGATTVKAMTVVITIGVIIVIAISAIAGHFFVGSGRFVIENGILVDYLGFEKEVIIPYDVTAIADGAFDNCKSIEKIIIPNSVTTIGESAFRNCTALQNVQFPQSVTTIENWAFSGCSSLTYIVLPKSIISIGTSIFSGCQSLKIIYCENVKRPDGWERYWFDGSGANIVWNYKG